MRVLADQATTESLDYADRWLRDGLAVLRPTFSVLQTSVDMTRALQYLDDLRRGGVHATSTHLLIHATARSLARLPELHQIVAGSHRRRPHRVDIGLSVSGDAFVAPVLVIESADKKSIAEIAEETTRRAPEIRQADRRMLAILRKWGWLVPFGFLRRGLLKLLFSSATFRTKGAGTFQVSTSPLDWAFSSAFSTAGVLVAGQISKRVIAVGDHPLVRPVMTLTLSGDHGVWDGRAAARFLTTVKTELEEARPLFAESEEKSRSPHMVKSGSF